MQQLQGFPLSFERLEKLMMPDSPVYVLVVEDDFLNRLHAVNLVEDAGYIAVEASNADEAITIWRHVKTYGLCLRTSICRGRWTALNLLMPCY